MNVIKCRTCKKDKAEQDFYVRNGKRNVQCITCRDYHNKRWALNSDAYRDKRKEYYVNNKERHKLRNFKNAIKYKYKISVDDYQTMLKGQEGKCAICQVEFVLNGSKKDLNKLPCVDHCHRTNKVRALLCRKCNVSLGLIESGFFDKAKEYLRVHEILDKEPV